MTSAEKEQLDITWLYYCGDRWQFRIGENTPDYHSKSFPNAGRSSDASLEEARNYRNAYLAAHPHQRATNIPIALQLQKNNRSGIVGVHYSEPIAHNGKRYASWQWECRSPDGRELKGRIPVIKSGSETRALMLAVEARRKVTRDLMEAAKSADTARYIQQAIDEYDDIIADLKQSLADDKDSELLAIIREARLDATSKQSEIRVRLGQHRFRRLVLTHWQGCCAVTGADILIEASHIKPWRSSSNFDRINPYNGIALSPLYHRAFDLKYISFADDGGILVSEEFRERLVRIGLNLSARITGLTEDHQPYLEHNRKHFHARQVRQLL